MTRTAVADGFATFVDRAIAVTAEEFSLVRALRGRRGAGGVLVDGLVDNAGPLRDRLVRPELDRYRDRTLAQFEVVLDYAEADAPIETYGEDILAAGPVSDAIRSDLDAEYRSKVEAALLAHHRRLGDAVAPLIATPETDFWAALRDVYDQDTARQLLAEHFAFTEPLREHRDAFHFAVTIDPGEVAGGLGAFVASGTVEVEFTDEALRTMARAERIVIHETRQELAERYAAGR